MVRSLRISSLADVKPIAVADDSRRRDFIAALVGMEVNGRALGEGNYN